MNGINLCPHRSTEGHGSSKARIGVRIPMGVQKLKKKSWKIQTFLIFRLFIYKRFEYYEMDKRKR